MSLKDRQLCEALGFGSRPIKDIVEGSVDGRAVRLRSFAAEHGQLLFITVEAQDVIPQSLEVTAAQWPRTRDLEVGDESFDARVHIRGTPVVAGALLGAELRRWL